MRRGGTRAEVGWPGLGRDGSGVGSYSGYGWSASSNGAGARWLRLESKWERNKKRAGYSFSQRRRGRGAYRTSRVMQYRKRGCPRAKMRGRRASRTSGLFTQLPTKPPKREKEEPRNRAARRQRGGGAMEPPDRQRREPTTVPLFHQRGATTPQVMMIHGAGWSLTRSSMRDGGLRSLSDFGGYAIADVAVMERGRATEPLFAKEVYGPRSRPVDNEKHRSRSRSVTNEADHTRWGATEPLGL
jgi:hypothetical protein